MLDVAQNVARLVAASPEDLSSAFQLQVKFEAGKNRLARGRLDGLYVIE